MAEVKSTSRATTKSKAVANVTPAKVTLQKKGDTVNPLDKNKQPLGVTSPGSTKNQTGSAVNGGNHTKKLWSSASFVQPKLQVGEPGDTYELEADAVASQVVQTNKENESSLRSVTDLTSNVGKPTIQPKKEELIQQQVDDSPPSGPRSLNTGVDFESQLSSSRAEGSPLPEATRNKVEPHLNADLSLVRVHTNSQAAAMSEALGAQAFTNQNHIYFNQGKYNPETPSGVQLIAHESTHTVQQGATKQTKPDPGRVRVEESNVTIHASAEVHTPINQEAAVQSSSSQSSVAEDINPAEPKRFTSQKGTESGTVLDAEAKEEEQKKIESPIKQRSASYKDEEVTAVKALAFDGTSEQAMESFATAGASAIALSYPSLGEAVNKKIGNEKKQAADTAPVLTAGNAGVKDPKKLDPNDPGTGKEINLTPGITEGEPAKPQFQPHENSGEIPSYNGVDALDKEKPKEESGGFWSWLVGQFSGLLGGISTTDNGVNTNPGSAPSIDTQGAANPNRTSNVSAEGKSEVATEQQKTANDIKSNPGQENIQPLYFEEEKPVLVNAAPQATALTLPDQNMQDFADLPLPESVRKQVDMDMAATMEKSLSKPREDASNAAKTRDSEKQKAVDESNEATEKLNADAEKQQQDAVASSRKAVAEQQEQGIKEVQESMNSFNKDADTEQQKADADVQSKIKESKAETDTLMAQAETDAKAKKKEGDEQAAAEKKAAAEGSKKGKSWWGRFKDAVSSAVSWVTEKIGKIFDAIRSAVKWIIDKAKKLALAVIEAGRKWIIDKLDKFASWLKDKVNKYLKAFPALQKRINAFIDSTVEGAKKIVNTIADGLKKGVEAIADALGKAINAVLNVFETALTAAVQIAGALLTGDFAGALKIAFLAVCKIAGIDPQPILNFIEKAGETIGLIFKDPIGFFKNVASGVSLGIDQFVTNIKQHLISGLIGWLTGALSDVPIKLPSEWNLRGIFSFVMQILGLTYENLRAKLVKRIGPNGEEIVSKMEKAVAFVQDLIVNGPMALWGKIQDKFEEIKEAAMAKIREVVSLEVVKAGIKWVLSLLNPASAIVRAIIMLYDFVMFLIERKDQIVAFVSSIFDTVGPLARGQIKNAANAVESAMGKGVPVILSLLASLAGIGGIGKSVQKVLQTIRKPVDKVVDPIIDWLVTQGEALFSKGRAVYESGKEKVGELKDTFMNWWNTKKSFKNAKGEEHTLEFSGSEKNARLMMRSTPTPLETVLPRLEAEYTNAAAKAVIAKINIEVTSINNLKYDPIKKEDIAMSKSVGAKIQAHLNTIAALLADPVFGGKESVPPTEVDFKTKKLINDEVGTDMTAFPLSIDPGGNAGSQPYEESDIWLKVNQRPMTYIRGHLLNHHVHGPGANKNLIPITRSLNTNMESKVEDKVKHAVLGGKKVLKYRVWADYGHAARVNIPEEALLPTKLNFSITPYVIKDSAKPGNEKSNWKEDTVNKIAHEPFLDNTLPADTAVGGTAVLYLVHRSQLLAAATAAGLDIAVISDLFSPYYIHKINQESYANNGDFITRINGDHSWKDKNIRDQIRDNILVMIAKGVLKYS